MAGIGIFELLILVGGGIAIVAVITGILVAQSRNRNDK